MKRAIAYITLFFITPILFASHGWQRVNHMQSTIFSAYITINNSPAKVGDVVGAFVGEECRMIAPVKEYNGKTFVSSVIHGDVTEQVTFKLWLQEKDTIITYNDTLISKPGDKILEYKMNYVMKE